MANNPISTAFPTICRLLENSVLDEDIRWVLDLLRDPNCGESIKIAFTERMFHLNDLMLALSSNPVLSYNDPLGPELEHNLVTIINTVGFDKVRSAYRKKLLVNSKDKLEDVRYEIAVAAKACCLFDPGSVNLEVVIEGTNNDSDVRGTYQGCPVRLEVTVLHDSLPPATDERLEEIVRNAKLSSGFILAVSEVIDSEMQANRIRALIELLHEEHTRSGVADVTIDEILFKWCRGCYKCEQPESPIRSIEFDLDNDVRLIERAVQTRSMTPQYMIDEFEQPEGVVTLADLPHDRSHQKNPLSSTIHKKIADKLKQCEDGVVNIVVLGKPLPMSDNSVDDALYSVLGVYVQFTEDECGVRHYKRTTIGRDLKGPFVSAEQCPDVVQFVNPFRKVSAVWLLRLDGAYRLSKCLPNPNARNSVPRGLAEAITDDAFKRHPTADQMPPTTGPVPTGEEEKSTVEEEQDEHIIWTEMAGEFVAVCGGVHQALAVLGALEQSGATLVEIKKRLEEELSSSSDKKDEKRFVSPSNEEEGMQFILGCGGLEQARACLEEWVKEHQKP